MNSFNNLEKCVIKWAESKGIISAGDKYKQAEKMIEEAGELFDEVVLIDSPSGSPEALKMELGDVLVTLAVQAHMNETTLEECLRLAYNKINKRKGTMIDGVFVKED